MERKKCANTEIGWLSKIFVNFLFCQNETIRRKVVFHHEATKIIQFFNDDGFLVVEQMSGVQYDFFKRQFKLFREISQSEFRLGSSNKRFVMRMIAVVFEVQTFF